MVIEIIQIDQALFDAGHHDDRSLRPHLLVEALELVLIGARPFRDAGCNPVVFRGEQGFACFVEGCAAEFKIGDMRFGSGLAALAGEPGL